MVRRAVPGVTPDGRACSRPHCTARPAGAGGIASPAQPPYNPGMKHLSAVVFLVLCWSALPAWGSRERVVTDEDRRHWSYRPLKAAVPPVPRDALGCRTPVDAF